MMTNIPGVMDKAGNLLTDLSAREIDGSVRRRHDLWRHVAEDLLCAGCREERRALGAHHRWPDRTLRVAGDPHRTAVRHDDPLALIPASNPAPAARQHGVLRVPCSCGCTLAQRARHLRRLAAKHRHEAPTRSPLFLAARTVNRSRSPREATAAPERRPPSCAPPLPEPSSAYRRWPAGLAVRSRQHAAPRFTRDLSGNQSRG